VGTAPRRPEFAGLDEVMGRRDYETAGWPPAVVASVFQTGLNLMRDLEQKKVRTVGVDCNGENPGFRSRYGRSYLCPNPDKEPEAWLEFMVTLAKAMGERPVLIAASDIFVSAIGRHVATLKQHYIFSERGCTLQASLATKETQYALAKQNGLPSPAAEYVRSTAELEAFAAAARFPVLLKPRHQREWQALPAGHPLQTRKTVSAQSAEELRAHYATVSELVPEAVVQEEIVGPDSAKYCYLAVYAQSGQRLGACVVHELRAYPLLYGCATLVRPVVDEEIDRVCDNFLRSLGYVGLCEIEVKRDARDGRVLLIEVNPRFSGTGDSAKYTGVETGYLHYLDLAGRTPNPMEATNFNFQHVMLVADLAAFPKYRELGETTWGQWLRSLNGPLKFFDFDPGDIANAQRTLAKGARALLGGLWHSGKSRS
jgi:D-aspartate ligase